MQIAKRVQGIAASQSLEMAARAKAMKAAGIDVISMSLGEPDMDTPEHVRRAAQEAIDNHWSHYGPVAGIESLREAIAERANKPNPNNVLWTATGSPIGQSPSPIKGREQDTLNTPPFREEQEVGQIRFTRNDVVVSVGAKMAIYNAIQTVINPGDEVIIPMPSWVSYSEMVKLAEGVVVPIQTKYEDRYCMTAEQLRKALTEKTRMLILCSPNNPTGSVYSREELSEIVEVLKDWPEVWVLSDEIYSAITYPNNITENALTRKENEKENTHSTSAMPDGPRGLERNQPQTPTSELAASVDANTPNLLPECSTLKASENTTSSLENNKNGCISMAAFPEIADRLIVINGVSKAYAMTGYRIGWLLCQNKAFIQACIRLQGQQLTCATMVAQKAAEAALRGSQECVEQMRQVFAERRELICRLARKIPGWKFEEPQGAFYLFPDVKELFEPNPNPSLEGRAIRNADDLAQYLLEEAHVAVVSGSAFGCPECIRLSYAISTEEIIEAMRRIKNVLSTKT